MLKRITLIVIILVFAKPAYDLFSPFVYSFIEDVPTELAANQTSPQPSIIETSEAPKEAEDVDYPNKVSSLQTLTDAFYYNFSQYNEQFTIQYSGDTSNISELIEQASQAASKIDPFIEGHISNREISFTYSKSNATINVSQSYLITAAEASSVSATVDDILARNNAYSLNDFEKIKFVNDFIVKNTVYSTETKGSPHSAYTALAEGKAVCQGYALLAQIMLTELGIDSLYVVGEAGGIGHAWNLVKLDGNWYHLDTTWNDPTPDRGPDSVRYAYFLVNDMKLAKDHIWIKEDYPAAVQNQYAYMHNIADSYETDQYIYFSNEEDEQYLYRLNKTTKQKEKVLDVRVQYLTGEGNRLFFSNYSRGGYLTELQLPSLEEKVLIREHVKNLFILEGFLYFTSDEGKKKMEL